MAKITMAERRAQLAKRKHRTVNDFSEVADVEKRKGTSEDDTAKHRRDFGSDEDSHGVVRKPKHPDAEKESEDEIASLPKRKSVVKDRKKSTRAKKSKSHLNILSLAESDTEIDDDITDDFEKLKRKNEERNKSASAHSGKEIS